MNIIFDNIVFSQQRVGGISIVWYEIIKRIQRVENCSVKYIDYQKGSHNHFRKNIRIPESNIIKRSGFLLKVRRYFNPNISLVEKTIFHSSYYRICKHKLAYNVTTVHDFTYERYYHGIAKWLHCNQKYNAIKNSNAIICISENTKMDLLKYVPSVDEKKISVIYNGVSDEYFKINNNKDAITPFPAGSFILFVGSRKAYKRFDFAVDIANKFNFTLVIAGGGDLISDEIELLKLKIGEKKYAFMGSVENSELNILYNYAFCLLYPSEYEGFGIPVIEAQKAGCPVIAFDGSSVKEIAGDSALLFKTYSNDSITEYIKILKDETQRNIIINKGLMNSSKFSWDNSFSQLMLLYKKAIHL
jgi:glycosyltransferase involved in cell wall biosynthesis